MMWEFPLYTDPNILINLMYCYFAIRWIFHTSLYLPSEIGVDSLGCIGMINFSLITDKSLIQTVFFFEGYIFN